MLWIWLLLTVPFSSLLATAVVLLKALEKVPVEPLLIAAASLLALASPVCRFSFTCVLLSVLVSVLVLVDVVVVVGWLLELFVELFGAVVFVVFELLPRNVF